MTYILLNSESKRHIWMILTSPYLPPRSWLFTDSPAVPPSLPVSLFLAAYAIPRDIRRRAWQLPLKKNYLQRSVSALLTDGARGESESACVHAVPLYFCVAGAW